MFVLHETCLEYFRRRLAEGWECISLEGHNAVLLSPDGNVRRKLDLRNDIETLRPTAAGDEENIANATSGAGQHWNDVKEAVPDGDATVVYTDSPTYQRDLYNIADHAVGTGIINHIIAYAVWRCTHTGFPHCKIAIKSGTGDGDPDTVSESEEITNTDTGYRTDSHQWDINPATGLPFTWDEIDKVQIGVSLNDAFDGGSGPRPPFTAYCTQVYVEIDYTSPVVATNAATGVNPVSGILNATLTDDLGDTYDGRFQWGKTEDYGNDTPWQAGAFATGDTFSQLIEGLEPGTLYHFRAQARDGIGTVSGDDVVLRTLKPSVGKGYAFSREYHIKRATDVLDMASIAASAITTLADCKGINLVELPSSLTVTVEATYDASAVQGIEVHLRTSLTDQAIGTHTGADGDAALTDAEANFVVDELIGLTIKNLTDGSSGVITANTATEVTATLVGGTNNDWDAGDAYIIEGAGYDTEDWDSFVPAFSAGASIRQTEHYDVDPVFLKVFVENLDEAEAVTDIKIVIARGT